MDRTELNKGKTGCILKGIKAINPVNGREVPVFLGDFVLGSYGTGAVMAVSVMIKETLNMLLLIILR